MLAFVYVWFKVHFSFLKEADRFNTLGFYFHQSVEFMKLWFFEGVEINLWELSRSHLSKGFSLNYNIAVYIAKTITEINMVEIRGEYLSEGSDAVDVVVRFLW